MDEVYHATDTRLEREVAIKVLPKAFAADGARLARSEQFLYYFENLQYTLGY
jgi:hypothetical protein